MSRYPWSDSSASIIGIRALDWAPGECDDQEFQVCFIRLCFFRVFCGDRGWRFGPDPAEPADATGADGGVWAITGDEEFHAGDGRDAADPLAGRLADVQPHI